MLPNPSLPRLLLAGLMIFTGAATWAQANARNGQYLAKAAGCAGCHTEAKSGAVPYAGGRKLETPFGNFYGPNITPDPQTGLGKWTESDFRRAIRQGERPDGSHYFPAFPYASFTGMSDSDIGDLWAYMRNLPASNKANREHELRFPFSLRFLVTFWKTLFFTPGPVVSSAQATPAVKRGEYLVRTLGHCGECHTPRNALGGPKSDRWLAGAKIPEGKVPNITPTRLKKWSDDGLKEYLLSGNTPGGDVAVEPMAEVVNNTTSQWTADDMAAAMAYLRTVPAMAEEKQ